MLGPFISVIARFYCIYIRSYKSYVYESSWRSTFPVFSSRSASPNRSLLFLFLLFFSTGCVHPSTQHCLLSSQPSKEDDDDDRLDGDGDDDKDDDADDYSLSAS